MNCALSLEHVKFKVCVSHSVGRGSYQAVENVAGTWEQGQGGKGIWETSE